MLLGNHSGSLSCSVCCDYICLTARKIVHAMFFISTACSLTNLSLISNASLLSLAFTYLMSRFAKIIRGMRFIAKLQSLMPTPCYAIILPHCSVSGHGEARAQRLHRFFGPLRLPGKSLINPVAAYRHVTPHSSNNDTIPDLDIHIPQPPATVSQGVLLLFMGSRHPRSFSPQKYLLRWLLHNSLRTDSFWLRFGYGFMSRLEILIPAQILQCTS